MFIAVTRESMMSGSSSTVVLLRREKQKGYGDIFVRTLMRPVKELNGTIDDLDRSCHLLLRDVELLFIHTCQTVHAGEATS
jgi:hypothetical protein